MEGVFLFLLVIAGIAIAAVGFCAWVLVVIIRGIFGLIKPKSSQPPRRAGNEAVQVCNNAQCRCANPAHARFCRRCGKSLPSLLRVVAGRAAVL
jgi:hypothetical protein